MENIPKTVDDPFHRYRRQRVKTAIGKANTTIITNAATIAHAINRLLKSIADYLKTQLATNVIIKGDTIVLKGTFTVAILDDAVEQYIVSYVLCKICGNVETIYESKQIRCKACGSIQPLC